MQFGEPLICSRRTVSLYQSKAKQESQTWREKKITCVDSKQNEAQ